LSGSSSGFQTSDVHTHLFPSFYLDLLRERTEFPRIARRGDQEICEVVTEGRGAVLTPGFWSVEAKLAFMDRAGIGVSLISLGNPWLRFVTDDDESAHAAREINRTYRGLVESQERFEALGVLPSWNLDLALEEARRVADEGILKGFISGPTVCGRTLDDAALDPLWEVLSSAGFIFMIHPGEVSVDGVGLGLTASVSFPFETTLAAARLVDVCVPSRFSGIRFLLSHGGGALPFLLARMDHFSPATGSNRPSEQAKAFFVDNLVYQDQSFWLAGHAFGSGHVMFGTDHPFTDDRPEALHSDGLASPDLVPESVDHLTAKTLLAI
jgi:predicted TIM-barrel fold metal-dependent hydrolase